MNWIRLSVTMKGDASVHRLAELLTKGDVPKVIGHLHCLFSEFPAHARDGNVKDVPDSLLEQWAMWSGKRGVFATAFRDTLCLDRATVRAWDKYNGAAIRENDAARDRMKAKRDAEREAKDGGTHPEPSGKRSPNVRAPFPSDVTGRDGKEEEERGREDAPPSSSAGLSAEFVDLAHRDAYLGARRSARNPGSFDGMLGSLRAGPGAPRCQPLTWHQIGTAILQITGQPTPPPLSANVIGGYAVKIPAEPAAPKLTLMPADEAGTVRDALGKVVWTPGDPPLYKPTAEQIAANGWSVAA